MTGNNDNKMSHLPVKITGENLLKDLQCIAAMSQQQCVLKWLFSLTPMFQSQLALKKNACIKYPFNVRSLRNAVANEVFVKRTVWVFL